MKLPSLSKLARHKQFDYQPRYYDPIKEEVQARAERIRQNITQEKTGIYQADSSKIREAFQQSRRKDKQTDMLQLMFVVAFSLLVWGYFEFGNMILLPAVGLMTGYVWLRIRKR